MKNKKDSKGPSFFQSRYSGGERMRGSHHVQMRAAWTTKRALRYYHALQTGCYIGRAFRQRAPSYGHICGATLQLKHVLSLHVLSFKGKTEYSLVVATSTSHPPTSQSHVCGGHYIQTGSVPWKRESQWIGLGRCTARMYIRIST